MNTSYSKIRHIQESNQILEMRLLSEQGFPVHINNMFIGDIEINGLKSTNQTFKIKNVNGDNITIINLDRPSQGNIDGVKDLSLNPNGKVYKITNGKGKFIFKKKK